MIVSKEDFEEMQNSKVTIKDVIQKVNKKLEELQKSVDKDDELWYTLVECWIWKDILKKTIDNALKIC